MVIYSAHIPIKGTPQNSLVTPNFLLQLMKFRGPFKKQFIQLSTRKVVGSRNIFQQL